VIRDRAFLEFAREVGRLGFARAIRPCTYRGCRSNSSLTFAIWCSLAFRLAGGNESTR